jgi:hypothetical protein
MAHPEWHRHPGALVAARGVAAGPIPAYVVGPAGPGRRPPIVLAVRRAGTDEWVPHVARPHQVLATWERWRAVIDEAVHEHAPRGDRRVSGAAPRPATGAAA